jgi:hypothetical protein
VRLPAAVLRDASPGGGLLRVLSAAAAYRAQMPDATFDVTAPQHRQQARTCAWRCVQAHERQLTPVGVSENRRC